MVPRLQPNEPGERKCLKCNKIFSSKGAANRICSKCAKVNASLRVNEGQLARQRGSKRLNGNLLEALDAYDVNFT